MEPVAASEPFDDPNYTFEVKWDGVRMLAFCLPDSVRLQNRRLHDRTIQYPELQVLSRLLDNKPAILDGEVVAFSRGRPDFFTVMERDSCRSAERVKVRSRDVPVLYMVFDMLHLDGENLLTMPLWERKERLRSNLREDGEVAFLVSNQSEFGKSLFQATREQSLEGIVGKQIASPYVVGKKSSYWVKVKHKKRQLCVICGYSFGAGGHLSILAGAWLNGNLVYVGKVSSGLSSLVQDQLVTVLKQSVARVPSINSLSLHGQNHWVTPQVTFICEFLEWTEDIKMRAPVFVGFTGEPPEKAVVE